MSDISYSITRTINLGNYESVKVQVGLSLSCEEGGKKLVEAMYQRAKRFVDQKIEEETNGWQQ